MVLKDGSFYHEGPRMINANMEEHKDPRVRSSWPTRISSRQQHVHVLHMKVRPNYRDETKM